MVFDGSSELEWNLVIFWDKLCSFRKVGPSDIDLQNSDIVIDVYRKKKRFKTDV